MMRKIYLIRHGKPDLPEGVRMCIGSTDLPLGSLGRLQAALAGAALESAGISAIYCSRLLRSRQTAALIGGPVTALPGLEEMDAGAWDGLTFDEIRARWPALYELRGRDPSASPPEAETRESGLKRFSAAVTHALGESSGDIAVVAHASVMQTLLCTAMGLPLDRARSLKLPYGSVSRLTYETGRFSVLSTGVSPHPRPDAALCERLLRAADLPAALSVHCAAVAAEAARIARALADRGTELDEALITASAMLHDIARLEENHAAAGAARILALGYPRIAEVVGQHHDLEDAARIDEAAVVFIADKLVRGGARVTLRERFEKSREKCVTPQAERAHDQRWKTAVSVAEKINELCGKEVIR